MVSWFSVGLFCLCLCLCLFCAGRRGEGEGGRGGENAVVFWELRLRLEVLMVMEGEEEG